MENLLLIVDSTYALEDNDGTLYFRGSFSNKVWERYLKIADNIVMICRRENVYDISAEEKKSLQKCPSSKIRVKFIMNRTAKIRYYFSKNVLNYNKLILKEEIAHADGIIIRTLGSVSPGYVLKEISKHNKKYMYECVGNAWDAMWNSGIKGKILAPNAYFNEKKLAAGADAVLYVTDRYLQRWYPTNAPQLGISDVDIAMFSPDVLEKRITKIENREKGSKLMLGTAGSVEVVYKGQEYVIKAVSELKRRGITNVEYQLVGNGDSSRLKQIAISEGVESQIIFLGAFSHEDVYEWLDTIDIYVQPSMLEGMPRALIEAMSRAVPCFGSNTGGIPELLDNESMFKKRKKKEIADIIENISKETMKKQAKRNFEFSKKFAKDEKNELRENFYKDFDKQCIQ